MDHGAQVPSGENVMIAHDVFSDSNPNRIVVIFMSDRGALVQSEVRLDEKCVTQKELGDALCQLGMAVRDYK